PQDGPRSTCETRRALSAATWAHARLVHWVLGVPHSLLRREAICVHSRVRVACARRLEIKISGRWVDRGIAGAREVECDRATRALIYERRARAVIPQEQVTGRQWRSTVGYESECRCLLGIRLCKGEDRTLDRGSPDSEGRIGRRRVGRHRDYRAGFFSDERQR